MGRGSEHPGAFDLILVLDPAPAGVSVDHKIDGAAHDIRGRLDRRADNCRRRIGDGRHHAAAETKCDESCENCLFHGLLH